MPYYPQYETSIGKLGILNLIIALGSGNFTLEAVHAQWPLVPCKRTSMHFPVGQPNSLSPKTDYTLASPRTQLTPPSPRTQLSPASPRAKLTPTMHTVSYELFVKPKESVECHQTLSSHVGLSSLLPLHTHY